MYTWLPGTLRFRKPMIGAATAALIAAMSAPPSARIPAAPPASAARAIAVMCDVSLSGLPSGA